MSKVKVILTCEHGGNEIPEEYQYVFNKTSEVLTTHRAYDIGALHLFKNLKEVKADAAFFATTSRLLIELNRSRHHKSLFSEFTKPLQKIVKKHILNKYYLPYRSAVHQAIADWVQNGFQVIHVSVHTFTPVLNGEVRKVDIGLLFDPARKQEKKFCVEWKKAMKSITDGFKIKYNQPYLGKSDGFTTYLRKELASNNYVGIELEVNNKFFVENKRAWPPALKQALTGSFATAIQKMS